MTPTELQRNHEYMQRFETPSMQSEMADVLRRLADRIRYIGDGTDSELLNAIEQTLSEMDRK
jgi:hypothetical protein